MRFGGLKSLPEYMDFSHFFVGRFQWKIKSLASVSGQSTHANEGG